MSDRRDLPAVIAAEVPAAEGPGVAVGVVYAGAMYAHGSGMRDIARGLPITPDTLFPICSLSKSFTAALALQLVDQGLLALDLPIQRYLPKFRLADAAASSRITPRMVLSHTGGMGRTGHQAGMWDAPVRYPDRAALLPDLADVELQTEPGYAWSYCNEGYATIGLLVETLRGLSLEECFEHYIFRPTGMSASVAHFGRWRAGSDRAIGYSYGPEGNTPAEELPDNYGAYVPSGGICSSANEMARYLQTLLTAPEKIALSTGALAQLHAPTITFGDTGWGYGMGWSIGWDEGRKRVFHAGGLPGFATFMLLAPAEQFGVVALANGDEINPMQIAERVAEAVLGRQVLARDAEQHLAFPSHATFAHDPRSYAGTYRKGESWITITSSAERLMVHYAPEVGFPPTPARPVGPDLFLEQRNAMPLHFVRASDGALRGVLRSGHLLQRDAE